MASILCTACACYGAAHAAPRHTQFTLLSEGPGNASKATSIIHGGSGNDHIVIAGQIRQDDQWRAAIWSDGPRMDPVILDDLGFGGTTFDFDGDIDGLDFLVWVVGAVSGAPGRTGPLFPAAWERSFAGGPYQLTFLPTLDGGHGEARSVYVEEVSSGVTVVGWADDISDGPYAVVWTETDDGFNLFVLPHFLPGAQSAASDISALPNGDLVVVGWSSGDFNADGFAVEWRRTAKGWQGPRRLGPRSTPWTSVREIDAATPMFAKSVAVGAFGPNADEPQPGAWLYKANQWWMSEFPTLESHPFGRVQSITTVSARRKAALFAVGEVSDGTGSTLACGWKIEAGNPVRFYDLTKVRVTSYGVVLRQAEAVAVREYGRRTLFFVVGQAATNDQDPHAYLLVGGF